MRLHSPWALGLLVCLALALWGWRRWRAGAAAVFSSVERLPAPASWRQRAVPMLKVLRLAAMAALVVAIARPQTGVGRTRVSTEGVALMMAIDRSGSMNERMPYAGAEMSRLEVVKRVFSDFVKGDGDALRGRGEDLVGIVTFAALADTVCPLVRDPDALVAVAQRIESARGSMDGTAIGDGVALAAARLQRAEADLAARAKRASAKGREVRPDFTIRSKAIILLTDGLQNVGEISPAQAAELARRWGIRVYAIGIGGGRVRTAFGDMAIPGGGADMHTLRTLAEATGGRAWMVTDADSLRQVYEEIDRLEKTKIESLEYTDYSENFPPLARIALGALLLEAALGATLLRRSPA